MRRRHVQESLLGIGQILHPEIDDASRISGRTLLGERPIRATAGPSAMRIFNKRKPNVKALASAGDVDGLIKAAGHTELVRGHDGRSVDVGAQIREQALFALVHVAPDRARDLFVVALGDSSDRVRTAAVVALYQSGESERLAEAVVRLPAASGEARAVAVEALFRLHNAGSSRRLADALVRRPDDHPLSEEEEELVPALIRAEERPEAAREVVQLLISALGDERDIVVERAEALLVRLGHLSADALVRELAVGTAPHTAAALLGEIKPSLGLQPLLEALSHPDARVRGESCSALGKLRDPAAVEPLLQATRDPEHEVRVLAMAALDGMGTVAVAVIIAALLRPLLSQAVAKESPQDVANARRYMWLPSRTTRRDAGPIPSSLATSRSLSRWPT
jgi:HEAT repeat protein